MVFNKCPSPDRIEYIKLGDRHIGRKHIKETKFWARGKFQAKIFIESFLKDNIKYFSEFNNISIFPIFNAEV